MAGIYDGDKTWLDWASEVGNKGHRLRNALTDLAEQKQDWDVFKDGRTKTQVAIALGRTAGSGTAQAGSTSSITLASGDTQEDDFYNDMTIRITGGTGSGQEVTITDYVKSTKVASATFSPAPDSTSIYAIQKDIDILESAINNGNKVKRVAMGEVAQTPSNDLMDNIRRFT